VNAKSHKATDAQLELCRRDPTRRQPTACAIDPSLTSLTIPLTPAQLRRLEAAARSLRVTAETFTRDLLLGAVRSIEGERRGRNRNGD
jgi:hypothetical protein